MPFAPVQTVFIPFPGYIINNVGCQSKIKLDENIKVWKTFFHTFITINNAIYLV